jgi:uncharacterized protein YijF (DUF1287 family)
MTPVSQSETSMQQETRNRVQWLFRSRTWRWVATALLLSVVCSTVLAEVSAERLVGAARAQIGVTTGYDGSYQRLDYPGGDVPLHTGVCTDVLVRAYRELGIDLQQRVHEDIRGAFDKYPQNWGLRGPDRNIDHRRVPNLQAYFRRHGSELPVSSDAADFQPGDIVSWRLDSGLPHIGIVSDRSRDGRPLIIHNIGGGVREEDMLFDYAVTGRYRYPTR